MIIYPPLIEESAPAFLYHGVDNNEKSKITIPFEWNPAVPKDLSIGIKLQIKEYFTSSIIASGLVGAYEGAAAVFEVKDTPYVIDNITYTFPQVGQYYKLQIAYDDGTSNQLVYSSVALGRCISNNITLQITDLDETQTDQTAVMENCVDYKGIYLRDQLNEPLYSYRFDFKDQFGNVLESSGDVIWDNEQDECVFEGFSQYNSNFMSIGRQIVSTYDGMSGSTSMFYKTDTESESLTQNTTYTETINLSNGVIDMEQREQAEYFVCYWDTANATDIIDLNLGGWEEATNLQDIIKKYNIMATRSYHYNYSVQDESGNMLNYFNSSSISVSSIYQSSPTYHLNYEPQIGQIYYMDFTITTINGYSTTTSRQIQRQLSEASLYNFDLLTKINNDDGYIELSLKNKLITMASLEINDIFSDDFPAFLQIEWIDKVIQFLLNYNWEQSEPIDIDISFQTNEISNGKFYILLGYGSQLEYFTTFTDTIIPGMKYTILFKGYRGWTEESENGRPYWTADSISIVYGDSINGQFSIERSTVANQNTKWETLTTFSVGVETDLSKWSWRDLSVDIGTEYVYRIRQFNNGQYSIPITTESVSISAEDIFLSDADRQLKVRFNPKVSSMKETILETKTDTIGGKYPIFYRNGQVRYREIPISGLISYQMDNNQFFMSDSELGLSTESQLREATAAAGIELKTRTTNLVDYNVYAERIFREEVLQWLNNGKPKLFRSPTEGNFVVRLMNVSLSPNDTVGRMLWTFSATAYEIADTQFDTLKQLALINIQELIPEGTNHTSVQWKYGDNDGNNLDLTNIKNIVWSSLTPVTNIGMELTDLDGNTTTFYNYTGLFETPKDVVYQKLYMINGLELQHSTIDYEINNSNYDPNKDTFGGTLITDVWDTVTANTSYSNVYYLSLSQISSGDSYVYLNGTIIDLSDGQTRYYYDLGNIQIGEVSNNATGIIYYGSEESAS